METTGFSPRKGDRVIEIAIARVNSSGRIEDEYSTLINPDGRDTGAVSIHRMTNEMVRGAPLFGDVASEILSRIDGAVAVAHNANFEERFLSAELSGAGVATPTLPALCSLWLGRRTFDTPNHKLATLADFVGVEFLDAHAALGDVRAVAGLLPVMLDRHGGELSYQHSPGVDLRGDLPRGRDPVVRPVGGPRSSPVVPRAVVSAAVIPPPRPERSRPSVAAAAAASAPAGKAKAVRRCGHCRQPGHYRSTCPELR
nr:3'-5' exonuclease [Actinomycetales bacterium]